MTAKLDFILNAENPPIERLLALMTQLRDKDGGCPWDIEQSFASIAPYTIEEAYEVADAIEREDLKDLRDELGDLMFQVVFHSQMAREAGAFEFNDVILGITEKMIRRHPHVFGDASARDGEAQTLAWETQKAQERADKGLTASLLDDVPLGLPALKRAHKLQKRAAHIGFDWPSFEPVFDKVEEEIGELKEAIASGDHDHMAEEMGDLLFVMANLSRKLKIQSEDALRMANAKFERRFRHIEARLRDQGRAIETASLEDMEALWVEAKVLEKAAAQ
ncbi:nucleoside triphosphate pyrophosphohydrolase [Woodsholea maritima]|uniref:nucleoside triphosphate pyrophosphohydrolase n=1 Tax=Woodsholea maritima TaxID=240237 RepID=UPI00037E20C8|nr:nucleoside triphosphate pyrophosphohydrolase [Woodsholea maritima]